VTVDVLETVVVEDTLVVTMTVGVAAVVVLGLTPTQEQALEYLTALSQGDAYAGIFDGLTVIWRILTSFPAALLGTLVGTV
jgi:hypothetical protein